MVGLIGIDGVLWKGLFAPSVGTTNAVNVEVDVQIDEAPTMYLIGMTHALKILLAVVPGSDTERLKAIDAEGSTRR